MSSLRIMGFVQSLGFSRRVDSSVKTRLTKTLQDLIFKYLLYGNTVVRAHRKKIAKFNRGVDSAVKTRLTKTPQDLILKYLLYKFVPTGKIRSKTVGHSYMLR